MRCSAPAQASVLVGHDGSEEAKRWLQMAEGSQQLGPNTCLLSPPGVASQVPPEVKPAEADNLGRVWAVLRGSDLSCRRQTRILPRLDRASWAIEPPCIGTGHEWDSWEYAKALLGSTWLDMYDWQYLRYLQPSSEARQNSIQESVDRIAAARRLNCSDKIHAPDDAPCTKAEAVMPWWRSQDGAAAVASMLDQQGFCVLDDFLPDDLSQTLARTAREAWQGGHMEAGKLGLRGGGDGIRGDAVLWANTEDPAEMARRAADGEAPSLAAIKEQLASAAVHELEGLLDSVDKLVGEVLWTRSQSGDNVTLGSITTRSHPMFTCYPASEGEDTRQAGYLRHLDNEKTFDDERDNGRVLAAILYLNDGKEWRDEDEGKLRLFERQPPLRIRHEILPKMNRLVVFYASSIPHEVLPPLRDRFACTFWYLDCTAGPTSVPFALAPAASTDRSDPKLAGWAGGSVDLSATLTPFLD